MATSTKAKPKTKNTWKRKKGEDLDLPSGNVALVKRPGMEAFLTEGIIPDSLMGIINEAIAKGRGMSSEKMAEISKDPKTVNDMMEAMDRILVKVVVDPKVLWHKDSDGNVIPESQREEDVVYTDDVDFEDKAFIFNYAVGGTRDLERFREETRASVDAVQDVDRVRDAAV